MAAHHWSWIQIFQPTVANSDEFSMLRKLLDNMIIYYRPQTKFAKVMFLHVSVCPQGGVPGQVPGGTRYTPLGPGTPQQVPPWDQVPPGRYTPLGPGTPPWDQVHPSGTRYTPPGPGTPPISGAHGQVPPQDQVHPPEQCMLGDTGNKRAVRILLECILVVSLSVISKKKLLLWRILHFPLEKRYFLSFLKTFRCMLTL